MAAEKIFKTFDACKKEVHKDMVNAAKLTLSQTAFAAMENAKENVQKNFILRNNFTVNSIRYEKASGKDLNDLSSSVGALERAEYMARQEQGGERKNKNGGKLAIPTTAARRGSNANKVSQSMYYKNLRQKIVTGKNPSKSFSSHKARLVARAAVASKINGFVRMNDSLFKITRFRKSGDNIKFNSKMVYNLKHQSTHTPQKEWLEPAAQKAAEQMQVEFARQMDIQ